MEGGPVPSHALLMYGAALQVSRSVGGGIARWWVVVVMLSLAKAHVYTPLGDRRFWREEAPTERDSTCRAKSNFGT